MSSQPYQPPLIRERPPRRERLFAVILLPAMVLVLGYLHHLAREAWGFDIARPFTAAGILGLAGLLVPLLLAHMFLRRWGSSWADCGLNGRLPYWRITLYAVLAAISIQLSFMFVIGPMVQAFAPEPPDISHLESLPGNLPGYLIALVMIWITAAFFEELIFRGFLLNEIAALLGGRGSAWLVSAIITGIIFGLAHVYQGLSGILLTGAVGILMGILYVVLERNLWPLILAHGFVDTYSITMIYLSG